MWWLPPNVWGSAGRIPSQACSSDPFGRQDITQHCLSKSGDTSGTTAGDAPATGEQSPRVCASWSVGYCIPCSNGFVWMAVRCCVAPPELVGQATWQGKSGQRRLRPLLAWWRRGGETPSHHSWVRGWRKFSVTGAWWGLALWAKVSGLCMLFRGCVCTLQKRMCLKPSRCGNGQYVLALGEPAGIVPLAFALLTRPFSVLRLVFSPSRCFYGTHLPGYLRPLSMLWAN